MVKVTRTRTYKDKEGYMCTSDYESMEEVDDVPDTFLVNNNKKQRLPPSNTAKTTAKGPAVS